MATMNGRHGSPTVEFGGRARNVVADVIEVTELQVGLFRHDLRRAKNNAVPGIIYLVTGGICLLAAMPVLLVGIAVAISAAVEWPIAWCLIGTSVVAMIIAASVLKYAAVRLRRSVDSFQPSQCELKENVNWIKDMTRSKSTSHSMY